MIQRWVNGGIGVSSRTPVCAALADVPARARCATARVLPSCQIRSSVAPQDDPFLVAEKPKSMSSGSLRPVNSEQLLTVLLKPLATCRFAAFLVRETDGACVRVKAKSARPGRAASQGLRTRAISERHVSFACA